MRRCPPRREGRDPLGVGERSLALLDVEACERGEVVGVRVVRLERDQPAGRRVRGDRVDVELDPREGVEQLAVVGVRGERRPQQPDRLLRPPRLVERPSAQDDIVAVAQTSFLCFRYARRSS